MPLRSGSCFCCWWNRWSACADRYSRRIMTVARLITMPASHFSEKARWALDYTETPYIEERHANVLHKLPVRRAGGSGTVPVMVADGKTYPDSTSIVKYANEHGASTARLYPDDATERAEVDRLVALCDDTVGAAAAGWIFPQVLDKPALAKRLASEGIPGWEQKLMPILLPIGRNILFRNRRGTPERLERLRGIVGKALDTVSEQMNDGRPYLAGDRFTAADITFAALSSLFLLPPQFGGARAELDELAPAGRSDVESWREHPAGQFALKLYDKHRWNRPGA